MDFLRPVARRRASPRPVALWVLALAVLHVWPTGVASQAADAGRAAGLSEARRAARRAHLQRVGAWGLLNTAMGVGIAASSDPADHPTLRGFGVQTAGWGVVNTAIAGIGLLVGSEDPPAPSMADALREEAGWGRLLVLNQGLNVGYMMVGGALWIASSRGLEGGDVVRGHAQAVMIQGAGLFVLDGIAWLAHRRRMREIEGWAERIDIGVDPRGALRVRWMTGSPPSSILPPFP